MAGANQSRCKQVKSAVRPREKPIFEKVAQKKNATLSDVIRNYLLSEAKKLKLI